MFDSGDCHDSDNDDETEDDVEDVDGIPVTNIQGTLDHVR